MTIKNVIVENIVAPGDVTFKYLGGNGQSPQEVQLGSFIDQMLVDVAGLQQEVVDLNTRVEALESDVVDIQGVQSVHTQQLALTAQSAVGDAIAAI